jgi:hypothetical protein
MSEEDALEPHRGVGSATSQLAGLAKRTPNPQLTFRPALVAHADLVLGKEFVTGVWLAFAGGALLLAAAVASASHLLLERAAERGSEFALRLALGAFGM